MKTMLLPKTKLTLLLGSLLSLLLMITISEVFMLPLILFSVSLFILLILPVWNYGQMARLHYFEENSNDENE